MKIKELVKNRRVQFQYYFDGSLWYEIVGIGFKFPVPVKDIGTATFLAEDKAILFMRYIRQFLQVVENEKGTWG